MVSIMMSFSHCSWICGRQVTPRDTATMAMSCSFVRDTVFCGDLSTGSNNGRPAACESTALQHGIDLDRSVSLRYVLLKHRLKMRAQTK
jgi:hypothetical protein